jgi:hypothetical protein
MWRRKRKPERKMSLHASAWSSVCDHSTWVQMGSLRSTLWHNGPALISRLVRFFLGYYLHIQIQSPFPNSQPGESFAAPLGEDT